MARSTSSTPKRGKPPKGWREVFLKTLAQTANVMAAARVANVDRKTVYNHRDRDSDFAEQWDDALEDAADLLEIEARRRASSGVDKPIYYKGEKVDTVKEYSDTLMIFLLKAARPEKYRENYKLEELIERVAGTGNQAPEPAPERPKGGRKRREDG